MNNEENVPNRPGNGRVLRCPYCREARAARLSLKNHIMKVHAHADTRENLDAAVKNVRWTNPAMDQRAPVAATVEDLPKPDPDVWPELKAADERPKPVDLDTPVCICGDPIERLDDDTDATPWWIHSPGSNTPCLDAIPAKRTLASQGRKQLSEQMADTGERLAKAGDEIRALREQADAVAARLDRLDAGVMDPITVRKATLNQVWDKLMDAGNITGAQLVMRMIGTNWEGDWS